MLSSASIRYSVSRFRIRFLMGVGLNGCRNVGLCPAQSECGVEALQPQLRSYTHPLAVIGQPLDMIRPLPTKCAVFIGLLTCARVSLPPFGSGTAPRKGVI